VEVVGHLKKDGTLTEDAVVRPAEACCLSEEVERHCRALP